ncbi:hypothetical protein RSAG8_11306, partial [Rhizoctonia solani AG-8 WAC10335]
MSENNNPNVQLNHHPDSGSRSSPHSGSGPVFRHFSESTGVFMPTKIQNNGGLERGASPSFTVASEITPLGINMGSSTKVMPLGTQQLPPEGTSHQASSMGPP